MASSITYNGLFSKLTRIFYCARKSSLDDVAKVYGFLKQISVEPIVFFYLTAGTLQNILITNLFYDKVR